MLYWTKLWIIKCLLVRYNICIGGVKSEYGIKPAGQVWERGRAHLHTSLYPTRGWESKEEPWRDRPSKEPKEWALLGNCWAGYLN